MFWTKRRGARLAAVEEEAADLRRIVEALNDAHDDLRARVRTLTLKLGKLAGPAEEQAPGGAAPAGAAPRGPGADPVSARLLARRKVRYLTPAQAASSQEGGDDGDSSENESGGQ
jgi:hypothetical protein